MRLFKFLERKENPVGKSYSFLNPIYSNKARDIKAYMVEGYMQNPIVYRCVKEITTAAASCELYIKSGEKDIIGQPVNALISRPNIMQTWDEFLRDALSEYILSGNCYILQSPEEGKPLELFVVESRFMQVKMGDNGVPIEYIYDTGSFKRSFKVNPVTGLSAVIHWRDYNPINKIIGMSAMSAVAIACDVHNNGLKWNAGLLENGAKSSGILEIAGEPDPSAVERLKKYFKEAYQGAKNAGSIPVATDGAKFVPIDRSPVDMDYMNTMKEMAKYIASAFGVPLPLIDNDSSSFNNLEQAKERLWTDTVLPLLESFLASLSDRLSKLYGQEIQITPDKDRILALTNIRAKNTERLKALVSAGLMTINEARVEMGYDEVEGGDTIFLPSSSIPLAMAGDMGGTDQSIIKAMANLGMSEQEIFEATGIKNAVKS